MRLTDDSRSKSNPGHIGGRGECSHHCVISATPTPEILFGTERVKK